MILKIAWRNIWRNKIRSLVVMGAIAIGIWAGIFASSIANGLNKQRLDNVIYSQTSHLQIHANGFTENFELNKKIEGGKDILETVKSKDNVLAVTGRTMVTGMVSSASNGKGVMIKGIDPESENTVSKMQENVIDGKYFEGMKKNPILLGQSLAKKLNVKVRSKVVLNFQDIDNEIVSSAFRVVGIYKTNDARNDEFSVYVRNSDLDPFLGIKDGDLHEIAIMLKEDDQLDPFTAELKAEQAGLLVQNWKELIPGLAAATIIAGRMNYLLLAILLAALSFGIINTMLMTVLERVREFGMLMAVGMNKARVFIMIMLETIFLMLTAAPFGMLIAWLSILYFNTYGMDFSAYAEGFNNVGVTPIIYPYQNADYYPKVVGLVIIAAILASIYPALKAIRLVPAEAIRKI